AIASYNKAIELHPNSGIVHYHLSEALTNLGLDEQAISSLEKAIELAPNLSSAHQALENLQAKSKNRE
ncbi:MAG: tetratricopeptide repeat protein, partial [Okeania sp. SIO4D6]|nr:tetratricopeptide repeat protein [Okeania sp. SIO4D6]